MKKSVLLFLILWGFLPCCFAQKQGQGLIDSLLLELPKTKEDTNRVKLLNKLSNVYPYVNPDEGIRCGNEALTLSQKLSWGRGIALANLAIGGNYANKADYAKALEYEYKALKQFEELKDIPQQALMLRNIAIVHNKSKNFAKALEYNAKSLIVYEALKDKEGIAAIYNNIANVHYNLKNMDSVLRYDIKSLEMYKSINHKQGTTRMLGNIANFYAENGEYAKAMVYYFDALRREKAMGNKNGVTRNMGNIGETYLDIAKDETGKIAADSLIPTGKKANLAKAVEYLAKTIEDSRALKQTDYYLAFAEVLSEAYTLSGNVDKALELYKEYIIVRDSVYDLEKQNAAMRQEMQYEYGKREDSINYQKQLTEVKLVEEKKSRNKEKGFYIGGLVLVLIFSAFMYNRWRITNQQKQIIEKEKQRSEELLLNILPEEVADELKAKGSAEAKLFDEVTVMFTDFKDFTKLTETMSPQELVAEIHTCFKSFDYIIEKYGIEKIKTIGDSYMCAGGLHSINGTHTRDVVKAALEIQEFIQSYSEERLKKGLSPVYIRLGIHTGPVVAGIVGVKKFAYDIWGDTVNIASRMESSGEIGRVNVSGATYELIKAQFRCSYRGKVAAKNKGEIDMYFVEEQIS